MKRSVSIKLITLFLAITVFMYVAVFATGCGNDKQLDTPTDFTFNTETGEFSFKTVDGAQKYQVAIQKILPGTKTGAGLSAFGNAFKIENEGSDSFYVWSELTGGVFGLEAEDGADTISGKVGVRTFSAQANKVPTSIHLSELPVGEYYVACVAEAVGSRAASKPAWKKFTVKGALEDPDVFTVYDAETSQMRITVRYTPTGFWGNGANGTWTGNYGGGEDMTQAYFYRALTSKGLPQKIEVKINDGSSDTTYTFDDYTYVNQVVGPQKFFRFPQLDMIVPYDSAKTYKGTAKAIGAGDVSDSAEVEVAVGLNIQFNVMPT